ncbi:MAG TPA: hypothetical protein VF407_20025 [Polyangiaceae bacterium]
MTRAFLCCVALPLVLVGCGSDSSQDQPTDQIVPSFDVDVDTYSGGSTYISAILGEPDSFTDVELKGGDALVVSSDTNPNIPLEYDSTLQIYSTQLNGVSNMKTVSFALNRTKGTSAPKSSVTVPDSTLLTAPADHAQVSAASGTVKLTWSNPDPNVVGMYFFAAPCDSAAVSTDPSGQTSSDNGSFDLPVSGIVGAAPTAAGQCIQVFVERDVNGTFDPAWSTDDKRTFVGKKTDEFRFLLTP